VGSAFVRARGGDRAVAQSDDRDERVGAVGMPDADPPARSRVRVAADDDVAAGVDLEISKAVTFEDGRGPFGRPALDVRRRVKRAGDLRVEGALGLIAQLRAARDDLADIVRGVGQPEPTAVDERDLARRAVGAEGRVNAMQPRAYIRHGALRIAGGMSNETTVPMTSSARL
jgi:hypothetical protein